MWSYFIQGVDTTGNDTYYVLVGVFETYEEALAISNTNWIEYFAEKYDNVQFEEFTGTPIEIRPNLCETIYKYRDFGNEEEDEK